MSPPVPGADAFPPPSRAGRALLLSAVFLTGATALAYEVAWTRGLSVVLGATATTAAVVLAVFVGALGLGARWGGRKADAHPRPLALYGGLEIAAALWALLSFFLADRGLAFVYVPVARALPVGLHLPLRVLLSAALVGPAAFLLGATLPALVRHWVGGRGRAGSGTAWLYGANTLGAVLGAWGTGFVLVARFGVGKTVVLAALVASGVGLAAVAVGRNGERREAAVSARRAPAPGAVVGGALLAAFLCGVIGLGVEIAGFRILVFFIEGFTLTFAAMLGVFVLGLGAGSLLLGSWMARSARPERWLALLLAAAAAILVLELTLVVPELEPWMRGVKDAAYRTAASPVEGLRRVALAGSMALLFAPAFVLGATFSLTVRQAELAGLPPGEAVGRVYLANSAGTVLAPFLVTFILVPFLGPLGAWSVFAFVALGAAGVVLGPRRRRFLVPVGVLAVVGGAGAWALAPAEPGRALVEASHVLARSKRRKALRVESDASTTASVIQTADGERILYTDDFAAAATGRHYQYMRMLGHLPVLLADDARHAMVIGFGTGTTAGAVAAHDEVERIEVVEVSRAVLDLAPYFLGANRGVLQDPRIRVIRDDGRNVLLLHEPDLDVITLEPLMPYSPAGLPFYTLEFYALARDRLREGGVVCQWVPVHAMPAGLYAQLLRTFFEVFPDGSLWFFEQSTALIGRKGEARPGAETLARRRARVAGDLDAAGLGDADAFLGAWIASGRVVRAASPPSTGFDRGPVTDLDPYPEFFPTPRAPLLTPYLQETLAWLERLVVPGDSPPVDMGIGEARRGLIRAATRRALAARRSDAWATRLATLLSKARAPDARAKAEEIAAWRDAEAGYADALDTLDADRVLRWRLARAAGRAAIGEALLLAPRAAGPSREARTVREGLDRRLRQALALPAADLEAAERLPVLLTRFRILLQLGRCEEARTLLRGEAGRFPGAGGALLEEVLRALAAYREHGTRPDAPGIRPFFRNAEPCTLEGVRLLDAPLRDLDAVVKAPWISPRTDRGVRLAADAYLAAARGAEVEDEAARLVAALEGRNASARATLAALQVALGADARVLGDLLEAPDAPGFVEALRETGRRRMLARYPEAVGRAAAAASASTRLAFADAAALDGSKTVLAAVLPLLLDPERSVRVAAATAFVRHHPDEIAAYDPSGSAADRRAIVEKLRALLER